MVTAVRSVPVSVPRPRCPACKAFVKVETSFSTFGNIRCRACGFELGIKPEGSRQSALPIGLIHAEPGPEGNSHDSPLSNLQPNGKIKKTHKPINPARVAGQLLLFGGAE